MVVDCGRWPCSAQLAKPSEFSLPAPLPAQDALHKLKKGSAEGFSVVKELKEAYRFAQDARSHGKVCILLDWTLDIVLHDRKELGPGRIFSLLQQFRVE